MAVKTITITEDAYRAMKALKTENESFSELFLRISKRKPLSHFFGILSQKSGAELEKGVLEAKEALNKGQIEKIEGIAQQLRNVTAKSKRGHI